MRRVVLAALVAAAGVIAFNAPARAAGGLVHAASTTFNDGSGCSTSPGETTQVAVGGTVTWHNCDTVNHTITSDDNGATFNQPLGAGPAGQDVVITFNTPGSFPYHCTIHGPSMKGTIVVSGEAPSTTTTTTTHTTPTTQAATTTTKPTTTTTSTTVRPTTTTEDFNGVFGQEPPTEPTTTVFSTDTTRALGQGGGNGTSAGVVAALILGLGGIGTAVALVIRRMRAPGTPS